MVVISNKRPNNDYCKQTLIWTPVGKTLRPQGGGVMIYEYMDSLPRGCHY